MKYFGVGGAVGFDMIAAEFLIKQRDYCHQDIKIISVLPFPEWRKGWMDEQIRRQDDIMDRSDKVVFVRQEYCRGVYQIRDRKLVDESAYCISYCNRLIGGTAYTVWYAMQKGLQAFNASLWDLGQLRKQT